MGDDGLGEDIFLAPIKVNSIRLLLQKSCLCLSRSEPYEIR
jgi:hypothetical protein